MIVFMMKVYSKKSNRIHFFLRYYVFKNIKELFAYIN